MLPKERLVRSRVGERGGSGVETDPESVSFSFREIQGVTGVA
jgi:hypothetical protein